MHISGEGRSGESSVGLRLCAKDGTTGCWVQAWLGWLGTPPGMEDTSPKPWGLRAGGRWYLGTLIGGRGTGCPGGFTVPAEPVGRRRLLRCLWGKHQPPRSPWVTALTRLLLSGFNRVVVFLTDPWACLSSPDGAHVLCEQHVCPGVA